MALGFTVGQTPDTVQTLAYDYEESASASFYTGPGDTIMIEDEDMAPLPDNQLGDAELYPHGPTGPSADALAFEAAEGDGAPVVNHPGSCEVPSSSMDAPQTSLEGMTQADPDPKEVDKALDYEVDKDMNMTDAKEVEKDLDNKDLDKEVGPKEVEVGNKDLNKENGPKEDEKDLDKDLSKEVDIDLDKNEIPVVSRIDQRGATKDQAEADGDENYDPSKVDADEMVEAEGGEGEIKEKPKRPKSKAKAKAKAKASGKDKEKAKEARRKSKEEKAEKKKAKAEDDKKRARSSCKVRPAEPGTAEPANVVEPKEGGDSEADKDKDKGADATMNNKDETKDEIKPDTDKDKTKNKKDEDSPAEKPKKRVKNNDEGTFASRYLPECEFKATKFRAIRDVFVRSLSSRLRSQSRFQDHFMLSRFFLKQCIWSWSQNNKWPQNGSLDLEKCSGSLVLFNLTFFVLYTPAQDQFFKFCSVKLKTCADGLTYKSAVETIESHMPEFVALENVRA